MQVEKANHQVATMCRVLGVPRSGFYDWEVREPSPRAHQDEALTTVITQCWEASRKNYGAPRILSDLEDLGIRTSKKRVARLMRLAGICGAGVKKKGPKTTRQDKASPPADDLMERDFTADAPNRRWVADIKYVGTWAGFLYLASIVDVCSRAVVGWAMRENLQTELVTEALEMALWRRDVEGGRHPSRQRCVSESGVLGSNQVWFQIGL